MRTTERVVYAVCGAAMLAAVVMGGVGSVPDRPLAADLEPEPGPPSEPLAAAGTAGAVEAAPLPAEVTERILDSCFRIPSDADPRLSPLRGRVERTFATSTEGAAVVLWLGSAPDATEAIGSCVAVGDGEDWALVGRGHRPDPGEGGASVIWHTNAAVGGTAAALTGRTSPDAAEIVVTLQDGRRLRQTVEDGMIALAWTPVAPPARLLILDADREVLYDGPPAGYA